jgi:hypothetical protein
VVKWVDFKNRMSPAQRAKLDEAELQRAGDTIYFNEDNIDQVYD